MKNSEALREISRFYRRSSLMLGNMYRFGEFSLDPRRRTLLRGDAPISLTPKAFDVLFFLLQNPNRLVGKEELLLAVWGDTFVEDGNLTQYISHLRKALGESSEGARLIVTIARKGYQFAGEVVVSQAGCVTQQSATAMKDDLTRITWGGHPTRRWKGRALAVGVLFVAG